MIYDTKMYNKRRRNKIRGITLTKHMQRDTHIQQQTKVLDILKQMNTYIKQQTKAIDNFGQIAQLKWR